MAAADLTALVAPALSLLLGAGGMGGFWAWRTERARANGSTATARIEQPADMLEAMAAFQRALMEQARLQTADLRQELRLQAAKLDRAETRIATLEAENAECRAENLQIRGELREVKQRAESLEHLLRRAGIDLPSRMDPFARFEGGSTPGLGRASRAD